MPGQPAFANEFSDRPTLRLLPGGQAQKSTSSRRRPARTPVSALPSRPRLARKIRMICEMIGENPDTPSGTAAALRYMRVKQLAAARSVTRPTRSPLPSRKPSMNITFWEVFGRFGRRSVHTLGGLLRQTRRQQPAIGFAAFTAAAGAAAASERRMAA